MSATGIYDSKESGQTGLTTSQAITYDKPYVAPPRLPVALSSLDIGRAANIRIKAYPSDITKTGFTIHTDSWSDTQQISAGANWVEIAPAQLEYQTGQFSTTDDHPWNQPQAKTCRRINFAYPYVTPPKVISFINQIDMLNTANWRLTTKVTDIDTKGFSLHIDTWNDTTLYSATAGWIAYPEDRPGVYSGSVNTMDVRAWDKPQLDNSKAIDFGGFDFGSIPSVFVGLNSIDIGNAADLRIKAYVDNVSSTGLTWHLDSAKDSILYSAGLSYLCIAA